VVRWKDVIRFVPLKRLSVVISIDELAVLMRVWDDPDDPWLVNAIFTAAIDATLVCGPPAALGLWRASIGADSKSAPPKTDWSLARQTLSLRAF
jgi:hypothetical protein